MVDPEILLDLMSVDGIGHVRIRRLVDGFGSTEALFSARPEDLMRAARIDRITAESVLFRRHSGYGRDQLKRARDSGVRILTCWDADFPTALRHIFDPPALLFVKGQLPAGGQPCIAVVGTRTPSPYGRHMAEVLGRELSGHGICVVSGLARGVDTWAHRGGLIGEGGTVAFLGNGVDVVYPPENARLSRQIMEHGALISEFPLGIRPAPAHFPRRNRLISGMSTGTIVVEAGEKSGALITAYMALEQGRDVFAVPGEVTNPRSRGPHQLIKEGAKLVESLSDVLSEVPGYQVTETSVQCGKFPPGLTREENGLWVHLSDRPIHIDKIALEAGVSTHSAMALLLSMELKDRVKQLPGMLFMRQ